MKKLLSIALTMGILVGMVCVFPASAAKYKTSADGMYKYEVVDKVYARLVECYAPTGEGTVLEIPSEVDGYKVKYIGFIYENITNEYYDTPETIIIPEGVTHIEDKAFYCYDDYNNYGSRYESSLKKVVLPSTVQYIGSLAFAGCDKLEEIKLSERLEYIGYKAFYRCEKLKELLLPYGLKVIESKAFSEMFKLKKLIIPGTVEEFGQDIVYCSGGTSSANGMVLKIEEGVTKIPDKTFRYIVAKKIILPKSLQSIGNRAFYRAKISNKQIVLYEHISMKITGKNFGYVNNYKEETVVVNKNYKVKTKESNIKNISNDSIMYANNTGLNSIYILKPNAKKKLTSEIGTSTKLKVYGKKAVSWTSSNTKVAKITANGKFKAIAKGTTKLTATLKDGTTYTRKVKVLNY